MTARREHSIQNVFVLALFAVFAVATLFALMFGAQVYKSMEEKDTAAYNNSMTCAYVAERLRHSADTSDVAVGTFGGGDALFIYEDVGGVRYQTAIYVCGGWLCELYTESGLDLAPDAGTQLLECAEISFCERQPGLIDIAAVGVDGTKSSLTVALRAGRCLAL